MNSSSRNTNVKIITLPIVLLCLICILFLIPRQVIAETASSPKTDIVTKPNGIITVGADQNYPPFEFIDEKGRPVGFNIDLLRALAETMGLKLEIRTGSWNSIRKAVEEGRIDMVSGMYYSIAREEKVDFSVSFIWIHESIFVRSESSLSTIEDLKGREVIVQDGDIMHDYIVEDGKVAKIIEVYNPLDGLRLLSSGRHDAVLLPKLQGEYLRRKHHLDNIMPAGPAMLVQKYSFGVAKGNPELVAILDQGLGLLKSSGKYNEIKEKWFGVIEPSRYETLYRIGSMVLLPLLLLLGVSWFWNWSLRKNVQRKTSKLAETLSTLSDREAHLRAVVECSSDAILVLDRRFRMIDCNPSFINQLGYICEEIGGRRISFILSEEEDAAHLEKAVFSDIMKVETFWGEHLFRSKSGVLVPMEISISEKILAGGHLEGYVAIMRNISKRKHAEEDKIRLEHQLRQIQKMEAIGTLAAGIAHDFNNILSSIIGYSELAKKTVAKESQASQDIDEVLESADRAKALVRQILTYSRQADQERRPEKLSVLVDDSLRLLRASLPAAIEINRNFAVEDDLVLTDATQISQVIFNLVTNSVQAMDPSRCRLDISIRIIEVTEDTAALSPSVAPGPHLELTISDTGHGIDDSLIERIFDPFFTTKGPGEGTGMGLAVVHGIVKDHGGFIRVDSRLGEGTSFQIILPQFEGELGAASLPQSVFGGNEHLLFIDDEVRLVSAWRRILTALGYSVTVATNPITGLEIFRERPQDFDLVLTDLDMPLMSGLELTRQLRTIHHKIPVILHTGFSASVNETEAEAAGISCVLHKPISTAIMAETLRTIFDKD